MSAYFGGGPGQVGGQLGRDVGTRMCRELMTGLCTLVCSVCAPYPYPTLLPPHPVALHTALPGLPQQAGILNNKSLTNRAQKASMYGWLGGSLCTIVLELYELSSECMGGENPELVLGAALGAGRMSR